MTPKEQGFFFPPEWHPHRATWLTFPHNEASWQGPKRQQMYPQYVAFIKAITAGEKVCLNVHDEAVQQLATQELLKGGVDLQQIEFLQPPTNDAWCRDHGPAFLINPSTQQRLIVEWGHNAWGGKYPPFDDDDRIPIKVAEYLGLPYVQPGIIMEGGSVEFNGAGTVLTSRSCLLNPNRNPHLRGAERARDQDGGDAAGGRDPAPRAGGSGVPVFRVERAGRGKAGNPPPCRCGAWPS